MLLASRARERVMSAQGVGPGAMAGVSAWFWLQPAALASHPCPPALQGPFCHDRWVTGALAIPWWHRPPRKEANPVSILPFLEDPGPSPVPGAVGGDEPCQAASPTGLAVSRGKGEHQHVSLCRTYINVTYCFYFLLSMEDIQIWRAGGLAELVLSRFWMLSSPVEEQRNEPTKGTLCLGNRVVFTPGSLLTLWERSSLGMPPLALLLRRDWPSCPHYSDPKKSFLEDGL